MKKYYLVRKAAVITAVCIIALSVVLFLVNELTYISGIFEIAGRYGSADLPTNFIAGFFAPLSTLIIGFGSGGILLLIALNFNPEKVAPFTREGEEDESDDRQ